MQNNQKSGIDQGNLRQQLDDMEVELETQNEQLRAIKTLLILSVLLQIPVAVLAVYVFYTMLGFSSLM